MMERSQSQQKKEEIEPLDIPIDGPLDSIVGELEACDIAHSPEPSLSQEIASTPPTSPTLDLASVFDAMRPVESPSGVAATLELVHKDENLPMKAIVGNLMAYTSCQLHADFSEGLGFSKRADFRRKLCEWHYQHESAYKGKRADQAFRTLSGEVEHEKQLEKELKGLRGES